MTQAMFQHSYVFKCLDFDNYVQLNAYYYKYNHTMILTVMPATCSVAVIVVKSLFSYYLNLHYTYATKVKILIIYDHILRYLFTTGAACDVFILGHDQNKRPIKFGYFIRQLNDILKRSL